MMLVCIYHSPSPSSNMLLLVNKVKNLTNDILDALNWYPRSLVLTKFASSSTRCFPPPAFPKYCASGGWIQNIKFHKWRNSTLDLILSSGLIQIATTIENNLPGCGHSYVRCYSSVTPISPKQVFSDSISEQRVETRYSFWSVPKPGRASLLRIASS